MSKLKIVDSKTMERLLFKLGFEKKRQKGSHIYYRHPDGRTTTIPYHQGRDLSRPLIRSIISDIGLNAEDYNNQI
jgi:predicted RNA binding protein YcfA (HicA-like mRNA interferase family)